MLLDVTFSKQKVWAALKTEGKSIFSLDDL
jgi:hypothetical protein